MAVKMRLQRHGSKKRPFYFIVVADARAPRDGKFIQKVGTYNPLTVPATIQLDRQKALEWLHKGAQPTDTVRRILSYKGVLYLKHLLRGVKLGLFDEATAMTKFQSWHEEHEANIRRRNEEHRKQRRARPYTPAVKRVENQEAPAAPALSPWSASVLPPLAGKPALAASRPRNLEPLPKRVPPPSADAGQSATEPLC